MELIVEKDCFLCLQTIPEADDHKELCLQNICRFLQLNPSAVLRQGLTEKQSDNSNNLLQDTNFSVDLCNACYDIAKKLSCLIHDLEVARLQANYYSEVFQNILEKADLKITATRKTDYVETADVQLAENLRRKLLQKCSVRNKKRLVSAKIPVVRLNRLNDGTAAPAAADEGVDSGDMFNFCPSPSSNSTAGDEYSEIVESLPPVENTTPPTSSVSVGALPLPSASEIQNQLGKISNLTTDSENPLLVTKKTFSTFRISNNVVATPLAFRIPFLRDRQFQCFHCETSFSHSAAERDHMISCHPEHLFCVHKPAHLSMSAFSSFCTRVFERETYRYIPNSECVHCATLTKDKDEYLRHLVYSHNGILAERMKPQRAPDKIVKNCPHCDKVIKAPRKNNLRSHMMRIHPEQIFLSFKPAGQSLPMFANCCRKVFAKMTLLYKRSTAKQPQEPRPCSYCTILHRCKHDYLRHLVQSHREIVGEKITTEANQLDNSSEGEGEEENESDDEQDEEEEEEKNQEDESGIKFFCEELKPNFEDLSAGCDSNHFETQDCKQNSIDPISMVEANYFAASSAEAEVTPSSNNSGETDSKLFPDNGHTL